jgi:hypothetical protein
MRPFKDYNYISKTITIIITISKYIFLQNNISGHLFNFIKS